MSQVLASCFLELLPNPEMAHLVRERLARTKATLERTKGVLQAACSRALAEGFFSHFPDFHEEILKLLGISPLRGRVHVHPVVGLQAFVAEAKAIVAFTPTDAAASFSQLNALALLAVTLESAVLALLSADGLTVAMTTVAFFKIALGYAVSYTMYWAVLCSSSSSVLMGAALAFLLGFVAFSLTGAITLIVFR